MAINDAGVQVERQYIGARYVPKFFEGPDGSSEWVSGVPYEPLTIVTFLNNSYTSKKPVPASAGNPSVATEYWANSGNYNAQVNEYREAVEAVKTELSNVQTSLNNEITERTTADTEIREKVNNNSLNGAKILIVGDSLSVPTEPSSWVNTAVPILETAGATVQVNAVGGRKMISVGTSIYEVLNTLPTDCDIVMIFLGVNDISYQAKIGAFNGTDTTTFNGAISGVISYFKKNPDTRIVFVTPLKCIINNRILETYPDAYRIALYQNCYLRGCEIIDAGGCAPCYVPQEPYTHDGVHPSAMYSPILGKYLAKELMYTSHAFHGNLAVSRNYSSELPEGVTGSLHVLYYRSGAYQLFVDVRTTRSETVLFTLPDFLFPRYVVAAGNVRVYNTNGQVVANGAQQHVESIYIYPKSQLSISSSW